MSDNGSERKDTEQVEEPEIKGEAEAAGEVRAEERAPRVEKPPQRTAPKKGLMERRESFAQTSVPNAHRGSSGKPPVIMLGIVLILFIASFILAAISS